VTRFEVGDVGEADQIVGAFSGVSGHGFQQVADVVAEVDAASASCRRTMPPRRREAACSAGPCATSSDRIVHLVTGLAAEQPSQANVAARQHMHGQVIGSRRDRAGVVGFGHPGQKPRGADADLGSEADQAARGLTVGPGRHHEHRVIQHLDQPVERLIAHTAMMAQQRR
jgi:hypothetical protein